MDGTPHQETAKQTVYDHIESPITPHSLTACKLTGVSPSSQRVEVIHDLLSFPFRESPISLTGIQLDYCKEALNQLSKKQTAFRIIRGNTVDREFDSLCSERMQVEKFLSCTSVGRLEINLQKNRYLDIIPYDDTMVLLRGSDGQTSYINASYVVDPLHETLPKFIATQGPLPNTNADFWEMVMQQQSPVIVMLTLKKCDNYFPSESHAFVTFGNIQVTNKETTISQNGVIYRLLEAKYLQPDAAISLLVLHMQLDWPDFGIPSSTAAVREMFRTLYKVPSNSGPFVVHCSAGIGRTGTFCTIDHTLRRVLLGDKAAVDIMKTVWQFRMQRFGMVQTKEQYVFCYKAVIEELQNLLDKQSST
ncbi:hypothetical protein KP509_34G046600 [Ceratopteris richardii]|uniref:Uncharacterized protein n=1 Tax=Ceratopteris richardii TaxID=49495 RepID=A0A8T2QJN4_CERRI|nr:hypothetical protein KP509_34G046600 [Ceratopteris richardii]